MDEDFCLSDYISKEPKIEYIPVFKVKEFIRQLKDFIENDDLLFKSNKNGSFISCNRDIIDFIDSLVGKELIE